ncbi:MAG: DUF6370 family protein [Planctomycetota bacterium]|nr:DUF6370 family protein [Planctomycetota bacterium]
MRKIAFAALATTFAATATTDLLVGGLTSVASAQGTAVHAEPRAAAKVYDESADAGAQIAAALAKAKREHTRVLIQWGANWCGWCTLLHGTFRQDAAIAQELRNEYEVVSVDVGRFDKASELATKYGAALSKEGIPYLTILAEDGSVVANHETGSLEKPAGDEPRGHDPEKVLAFLTKNQAPSLDAPSVLSASVAEASASGKQVFLRFGAPWCGWCHKMDAWISQPEVSAILSKAFVIVKIDTDRMTGGQALLTAHTKGAQQGIPWFEFLDGTGAALAHSTGPEGNVGFPVAPEEIAWFADMLTKAGTKLSAADIAALKDSLTPQERRQLTAAHLEFGCGVCIYNMPGLEGCPLAVVIDGTPQLVDGFEWPVHDFCDRKCHAIATGTLEGGRFKATSVEPKD